MYVYSEDRISVRTPCFDFNDLKKKKKSAGAYE